MEKYFYISTPLYYVNDRPHLGTAYSTIIADVLNRYRRFFGEKTFFMTGTDEHGQKCFQAATEKKLSPQEHCRQMRERFQKTWEKLNIKYTPIGLEDNSFFYTSHKYEGDRLDHAKIVQKALQKLKNKGDIYSSYYKGWYCVSEEIFYTEKDLVDGKSPSGKEVIFLEEKAWFFKMSKYHKQLTGYLEAHPDFIKPESRYNEIKAFLKNPLQDLCISRPKSRVSWGIELPFDSDCVVYVWVDALLNYITGLGYGSDREEEKENFKKYWESGNAVHLIGKDILMTHAVYWPCLLKALGQALPQSIFAHGWLLNKESEKMSKSEGDKLDPLELAEGLGADSLRWFLAREISLGKDFAVSKDYMIQKINEQLADHLGNILSRISKLIIKYFKGEIPRPQSLSSGECLKEPVEKLVLEFESQIQNFELSQALAGVSHILSKINKYLEKEAPWKGLLQPQNLKQSGLVLYNSLEALRICTLLIHPVMPEKTTELLSFLGESPEFKNCRWGRLPLGKKLEKTPIFFPKVVSPKV